jgi:polyphenol oxidase
MKNIYQIKKLLSYPNLIHGFSTKKLGNMSFFWGESDVVLNNRKNFFSNLKIDMKQGVSTQLKDSNNISIITKKHAGTRMFDKNKTTIIGDGLITKEKGIFLLIAVADCLPCLIFDTKQEIIGLLHLSWKSTEAKLCEKAIKTLISKFNSNPKDIVIGIGPGIHKESFSFKDPIQKQLPGWENFIKDLPNGNTQIDLIGYNISQLKKLKIPSQNIFISKINTAKNINFFSHFRDSKDSKTEEGRFGAIIGLKSQTKKR